MFLSDLTIKEYLNKGFIHILPEVKDEDIRPVGVRIHISNKLLIPHPNQIIDPTKDIDIKYDEVIIPEQGYHLKPNEFVLSASKETFRTCNEIVAFLDGRSTIARIGLTIHCTSFIFDGIHDEERVVVFEIKNFSPYTVVLKPFIAVGMLSFILLSDPINQVSQSQYKGQLNVLPPNLKDQFK